MVPFVPSRKSGIRALQRHMNEKEVERINKKKAQKKQQNVKKFEV